MECIIDKKPMGWEFHQVLIIVIRKLDHWEANAVDDVLYSSQQSLGFRVIPK
jgi:hypothetical protein